MHHLHFSVHMVWTFWEIYFAKVRGEIQTIACSIACSGARRAVGMFSMEKTAILGLNKNQWVSFTLTFMWGSDQKRCTALISRPGLALRSVRNIPTGLMSSQF